MNILWRIVKRTSKYKGMLFLAYLSVFGVTAMAMFIPRLLGTAVGIILPEEGPVPEDAARQLLLLAVAILAANGLRGIFAYGQQYLGESIAQRVAYDLRNEFYDHLQRMSFAFHDREQTGNLMSKATADVEGIRMFIQAGQIRSVYSLSLFIGVGIAMFLLNWELAILSLMFAPLVMWRGSSIIIRLRREWLAVQTELGHMTTVLQENLSGQRVVKAFAAEDHERSRYYYRATTVSDHSYKAAILQANSTGMVTFFYTAITVLLLWSGGRQVINGTLSEAELTQFIFYLGLLAQPVRMIAWVVNSFSRGISAGQRLFATLDSQSPVQEKTGALALTKVQGHVRFENVSFSYDAVSPVVSGLNFEAEPAKVIALVGAPGSGKSTTVHLIPRFYDVTEGRITIDDTDVRDATLTSLRANIGIVQQDVFLFTTSIKENISYGNVDASFDDIVRAAKIAQMHDFIETLPDGYDTWVGERGTTLSGGQRQRLAIARTVLLDPPILLLDDSTSSVDTHTESLIRQALTNVMKGRTTFVIAHRLSTVKNADIILVLKEGQIVQQGTHQELLAQPGLYQDIYQLQLKPDESFSTNGERMLESTGGLALDTPASGHGEAS